MTATGRLRGKRALVTGAAQGLGAGIAEAMAREGARVVLTDRNEAGVTAAADAINARYGEARAFACRHDVTVEADWRGAIDFGLDRLGGISVLVNNAGVVTMGSVEDLSLEAWRHAMAVNADSAFLGCKLALPLLRESQPASIVNISSVSALVASHNMAAYNASKAALWMLSKSVALHCARNGWNIRSNTVHPTFVRTPLLGAIVGGGDEGLAKLARQVPLGRIGEVADIVPGVIYLASDESAMMTGAELKLDGGLTAT